MLSQLVSSRNVASERIVEAVRLIERQLEISGYASAEAWKRLEEALVQLDGHPLSPSIARRLDRALND